MTASKIPRWAQIAGLVSFGVISALVLLALLLALFPNLLRPNMVKFTLSMGDIFYFQNLWIAPPENPDEVLAQYPIAWDEDGFRIPRMRADSYPIIALGDSFTEAANAPVPWPDVLAAALKTPVRNLGFRGFGPQDEVETFIRYATTDKAETIVLGFFEGNDLSNAVSAEDRPYRSPAETPAFELVETQIDPDAERDVRYPMQVVIEGATRDIAFLEGYVWALFGSERAFSRSRNLELTAQSWQRLRESAPESCIVIAYFPDKGHIYLPYLEEADQRRLLEKVERQTALDGQPLQANYPDPATVSFQGLLDSLPNQRNAVQARAAADGFVFFDLTPLLSEAAARGEWLYYTYDTHWNSRGHELAGQVLAEFLRTNPCDR